MAQTLETKTKLCSWGTSRAVRIPKAVCEMVGIEVQSDLTMTTARDAGGPYIIIRPERSAHRAFSDAPYRSMDELFAGYDGGYVPGECDWGADVGAEVLR